MISGECRGFGDVLTLDTLKGERVLEATEGSGDWLIGFVGDACVVFKLLENELRLGCGTIMGADLLYPSSRDRGVSQGLDPTTGIGAEGELLPDV